MSPQWKDCYLRSVNSLSICALFGKEQRGRSTSAEEEASGLAVAHNQPRYHCYRVLTLLQVLQQ